MRQIQLVSAVCRRARACAAIAALAASMACMASSRPTGTYATLGDPNPTGCVGPGTVLVNNTYGQPVDIYASMNGNRETLLGTAQPGRSEYAIGDVTMQFTVHPVRQRTILEATSRARPATDRVQFKTVCASAA